MFPISVIYIGEGDISQRMPVFVLAHSKNHIKIGATK